MKDYKKAVTLPSNFNDLSLKSKNKLLLMGLGYKLYDGKSFNKIQVAEKIAILKKINIAVLTPVRYSTSLYY